MGTSLDGDGEDHQNGQRRHRRTGRDGGPSRSDGDRLRRRRDRKGDGRGYYSERAVAAREAIHKQFAEQEHLMKAMVSEMQDLKQEQKKERKRMKKRRRLQRREDKREQKIAMKELHAEFNKRRVFRDEARAYRKLEREYGAEVAAEMQAKEAEERIRALKKADDDSDDSDLESVDSETRREEEAEEAYERAMAKASHGQFIGDCKLMCAANLPKVDGMMGGGSIDPYVKIYWNDDLIAQTEHKTRQRRPRYDQHIKFNFVDISEEHGDLEGTLRFEVWDYDRIGKDDVISFAEMESLDVRQRMCIDDRRPIKLSLQAHEKANKSQQKKWSVGALTLQFDCAENINYEAEKDRSKHMATRAAERRQARLLQARKDYAIR